MYPTFVIIIFCVVSSVKYLGLLSIRHDYGSSPIALTKAEQKRESLLILEVLSLS